MLRGQKAVARLGESDDPGLLNMDKAHELDGTRKLVENPGRVAIVFSPY